MTNSTKNLQNLVISKNNGFATQINNNSSLSLNSSTTSLSKNDIVKKTIVQKLLNINNKLILSSNKRIENYPHPKVNLKLSQIKNIVYNFNANKNNAYNNKSIISLLENLFSSFFSTISKPKFIETSGKLIIRIYFYIGTVFATPPFQSNLNNLLNDKNIKSNSSNNSNVNSSSLSLSGFATKKELRNNRIFRALSRSFDFIIPGINKKRESVEIIPYKVTTFRNLIQKNYLSDFHIIQNKNKFAYRSNFLLGKNISLIKLNYLKLILHKFFNKIVEIELVRLYNIGHEPLILAKSVSANTNEFNFRLLLKKLWKKVAIYNSSKINIKKNRILNNIFTSPSLILNNSLNKIKLFKNSLPLNSVTTPNSSVNINNNLSSILSSENTKVNNTSNSINPVSILFSLPNTIAKDNTNYGPSQINLNNNLIENTNSLLPIENGANIKRINYNKEIDNSSLNSNYPLIENASSLLLDNIQKQSKVIMKPTSPAKITGIKIRLAGRIETERIKPKQTVQTFQLGSLSKDLTNIVNTAEFTSKNKRGSFNIKV